jgi:hypothetical protein
MKIRDANGRANTIGRASGVSPAANAGGGQTSVLPPVSEATDQVQLSNLAHFAQMAAAYGDSPAHVAKLSSLSATVSSGGYLVEPGVVSDSIIQASMRLDASNYN